MTLNDYISELEKIRTMYGGEIEVRSQTLTHRRPADIPVIRTLQRADGKEVPFVLVNP